MHPSIKPPKRTPLSSEPPRSFGRERQQQQPRQVQQQQQQQYQQQYQYGLLRTEYFGTYF